MACRKKTRTQSPELLSRSRRAPPNHQFGGQPAAGDVKERGTVCLLSDKVQFALGYINKYIRHSGYIVFMYRMSLCMYLIPGYMYRGCIHDVSWVGPLHNTTLPMHAAGGGRRPAAAGRGPSESCQYDALRLLWSKTVDIARKRRLWSKAVVETWPHLPGAHGVADGSSLVGRGSPHSSR